MKYILTFLIFTISCFSSENIDKRHILYLMHANQVKKAFSTYQNLIERNGRTDLDLLQKMALILLQKGARSSDDETKKLSLFGAGLASSNYSLEILEEGLKSTDVHTQLLSLHFISTIDDNRSYELLTQAMSSDFLVTRFEAAFQLALKKHPKATYQIESLMYKLPPFFKPFFPMLFTTIGTDEATLILKDLLNDSMLPVRIEAIINVANFQRDDLLPIVRKRANFSNVAESEACSYAFGVLKDSTSIKKLEKLVNRGTIEVKLSALKALYLLGNTKVNSKIENYAKQNNLFAISCLGDISGSEELLIKLMKSSDLQVRINATISLLKRKNPKCLSGLKEIFIKDEKDLALIPKYSIGRSILYFDTICASSLPINNDKVDLNMALNVKEKMLKECLELNEEVFLNIAKMIFDNKQNDLIPSLCYLLENNNSEKAKNLLKINAQKVGAPLIRDYCNLTLFKIKEKGPYEKYVENWVKTHDKTQLIKLSTILPQTERLTGDYSLTIFEETKLLLEMYTTLIGEKDLNKINIVIDSIKNGNEKNRYALAGLLMKAIE